MHPKGAELMEKLLAVIACAAMGLFGFLFLASALIAYVLLTPEYKVLGIAFGMIGAAFLLMMLMLSRMAKRYQKQSASLIENGRQVEAKIIEVREITSVSINRKHPYVLMCEAEGRTFESEYFYDDPQRFEGKESIFVYVDESSGEYLVDLNI